MIVLKGHLIVEKLNTSKLYMSSRYVEEYQRCKIYKSNPDSLFKEGVEVLVGEDIYFDKVESEDNLWYMFEDDIFGWVDNDMLVPCENMVYIEADKYKNENVDGIYKTIDYKPLARGNVCQDGEVLSVCNRAKGSYFGEKLNIEISKGDKVYTHHFLTDQSKEREFNNKKYYELHYEDVYCKIVDGEIEMLNNWTFVTPVVNDLDVSDTGVQLEASAKNEAQTGIVQHPYRDSALYPGDKVLYKRGREYKIDVEGNTYYRIKSDDIIYNLDIMKALNNIIVIKPIRKEKEVSGIVLEVSDEKFPEKGEVLSVSEQVNDIKKGDNILFRKGMATHVVIEGQECMLIDRKNAYVVL